MPHIHEKIDYTVETFIVCDGKVLLRKHDKYNIWLSVGGHVELDEDPVQAAVREAKEEVGLDIELVNTSECVVPPANGVYLIPPVAFNRHRISPAHEHIVMIYFGRTRSNKVIPEKVTDVWKWCTKEDIDRLDPIGKDIAFLAKRAIDTVR